jgi:hypothetical protein
MRDPGVAGAARAEWGKSGQRSRERPQGSPPRVLEQMIGTFVCTRETKAH